MKTLSVVDRDRSLTGVQESGISSSISSELRNVPGPHVAVDASVAGYLTPKVLSMTVYYCSIPHRCHCLSLTSLPLLHSVSVGPIILLVKVPVNCCCGPKKYLPLDNGLRCASLPATWCIKAYFPDSCFIGRTHFSLRNNFAVTCVSMIQRCHY